MLVTSALWISVPLQSSDKDKKQQRNPNGRTEKKKHCYQLQMKKRKRKHSMSLTCVVDKQNNCTMPKKYMNQTENPVDK